MNPHAVQHRPFHPIAPFPDPNWVVACERDWIHCHTEEMATRVAQALDLLDAVNGAGPERISKALDLLDTVQTANGPININAATIHPLSEAKILQRAREASIAEGCITGPNARHHASDGHLDGSVGIRAAARALRDLAKPLSEVVPVVDADLLEARRIAVEVLRRESDPIVRSLALRIERGEKDEALEVQIPLAALKRGRELGAAESAKHFTASNL